MPQSVTGCSSSVERTVWDREVAGSIPVTPTERESCGISTAVVWLPSKEQKRVRLPYPAPGYSTERSRSALVAQWIEHRGSNAPVECSTHSEGTDPAGRQVDKTHWIWDAVLVKKLIILSGFVLGNFSILLLAFLFLTVYATKTSTAADSSPIQTLEPEVSAQEPVVEPGIPAPSAQITVRDARADLIEAFFRAYGSPMQGLGRDIVTAADRYQIPFGYLPAIAACEGALGQKIPHNSYNTWGWGIYGDKITYFPSWQYGIDAVAKGLKAEYFDKGLNTPQKIMPKYTPPSKGSWAICVQSYLNELQ